jgi:dTDP-4-amino-4,6-dideoxy-D-galactose acyltransferase
MPTGKFGNDQLLATSIRIFVVRYGRNIVGAITAAVKDGCGTIGLLAVDSKHRHKGNGSRLVTTAQRYFLSRRVKISRVVTQSADMPACKLYEKCGYTVETIKDFYHFWL